MDKPVAELLNCPFCGSENVDANFSFVQQDGKTHHEPGCMNCSATAVSIEAWNTRVPPSTPSPDSRNEVIEECAKVCISLADDYSSDADAAGDIGQIYRETLNNSSAGVCRSMAERIRALKTSRPDAAGFALVPEVYDCPIHGLQDGPDCPRC